MAHTDLGVGVDEYLVSLRVEKGLSPNTIAAYELDLRQYLSFLGDSETDDDRVASFVGDLRQAGLADSTVSRKIASVKGLHRFLVTEGMWSVDPTVLIDTPRRPDPFPKALTVEEAIRLVESPDPETRGGRRDAALLEFLYGTGARVSEAVCLDPESQR